MMKYRNTVCVLLMGSRTIRLVKKLKKKERKKERMHGSNC